MYFTESFGLKAGVKQTEAIRWIEKYIGRKVESPTFHGRVRVLTISLHGLSKDQFQQMLESPDCPVTYPITPDQAEGLGRRDSNFCWV